MLELVRGRRRADSRLDDELAALPDQPTPVLRERWENLYGAPPPPRLGSALLVRGVAYGLQARVFGGLKPATRRRLDLVASEIAAGRTPPSTGAVIKPGTRLLREWQGVTHEVIILDDGVRYRERTWRSLSAVAREITGARWSGPLFFGLKGRSNAAG